MHQHFGFREISRTVLTITGIVLLIIFGTRAASQASSMAAVGGRAKQTVAIVPLNLQWLTELKTNRTTGSVPFVYAQGAPTSAQSLTTEAGPPQDIAKLYKAARNLAAKAKRTVDTSLAQTPKYNTTDQLAQSDTYNLANYKHTKESVK